MDVLALGPINFLDLVQQVHLGSLASLDAQDAVGIQRAFRQRLTFGNLVAFLYQQAQGGWDFVFNLLAFLVGNEYFALFQAYLACVFDRDGSFTQGGNHLADLDLILVLDLDGPLLGNVKLVVDHLAVFNMHQAHIGVLIRLYNVHCAFDLGHNSFTLRHFT